MTLRSRVHAWLQGRSLQLRFVVLVSIAATAAYAIGSLLPFVAALPAAITAMVSTRPTFTDGVKEGLVQVGGAILGGFAAAWLTILLGPSPLAIGLVLTGVLAVAVLARLRVEAAMAIGVPLILIMGTHADVATVWGRLWGVAVGALIAMLVSLYTSPGTPTQRATDRCERIAEDLADCLDHVGEQLRGHAAGEPLSANEIHDWLIRVEALQQSLHEVRTEAERALHTSTWSPLTNTQDARRVLHQVLAVDIAASTAANMGRDLLLAQQQGDIPDSLYSPLGDMVVAAAGLIRQQVTPKAGEVDALTELMDQAQADALAQVRELDQTAPLALGGSFLQDSTKIRRLFVDEETEGPAAVRQ